MNEDRKRNNLIELRKKRNLTQTQVADAVGIERSYYTAIELGKKTPSLKIAIKLKNVLGYKKDDIFLPL